MNAPFLYFISNDDLSRFPLSFVGRFFRPISIASDFQDTDWFNWDCASCLVVECEDLATSFSILERIRNNWISAPVILQTTNPDGQPVQSQRFAFSAIVSPNMESCCVVRLIQFLQELDQKGQPSPFELRRRFGRLSCRERVVLQMALRGLSSQEISTQLQLRSQTVDKYRRRALVRMKARNLLVLLGQLYHSISAPLVFPAIDFPGHPVLEPSSLT